MRALLLLLVSWPLVAGADDVAPSTSAMKEMLHGIIRKQLEAFRRDDFVTAYTFAAEGIKSQFPLSAFEKMVRVGYPLIAKSNDAVFGLTLDDGDHAVVTVRITGPDQVAGTYQYLLERTGKDWRIAGVQELDAKDGPI